jgi:hypothetical protein
MSHPTLDGGELMRPPLDQLSGETPAYIKGIMEDCWSEHPEARPDFRAIRIRLKQMQEGM